MCQISDSDMSVIVRLLKVVRKARFQVDSRKDREVLRLALCMESRLEKKMATKDDKLNSQEISQGAEGNPAEANLFSLVTAKSPAFEDYGTTDKE